MSLIEQRAFSFHFWIFYRDAWATLLPEEALDTSFFFTGDFSVLDLKMMILTSSRFFVLKPCTRWLTNQRFYIHSAVHFKWEQLRGTKGTPSCTPSRTSVTKTYSVRIRNCIMDTKISKRRQNTHNYIYIYIYIYIQVRFCSFC